MFKVVLECLDFWRVEHLGRKNLAKMSTTMIPYMITMIRRMTFSLLLIPREGIETCARWLMCEHVVPFRNPWQISMVLSRISTGYGYGWLGLDTAGWQLLHPVQLIWQGKHLLTNTDTNESNESRSFRSTSWLCVEDVEVAWLCTWTVNFFRRFVLLLFIHSGSQGSHELENQVNMFTG